MGYALFGIALTPCVFGVSKTDYTLLLLHQQGCEVSTRYPANKLRKHNVILTLGFGNVGYKRYFNVNLMLTTNVTL